MILYPSLSLPPYKYCIIAYLWTKSYGCTRQKNRSCLFTGIYVQLPAGGKSKRQGISLAFSALLPGQVTIFGLDNPIACLYNTKILSSIIKDCFFGTNSVKSLL